VGTVNAMVVYLRAKENASERRTDIGAATGLGFLGMPTVY
jgi:hypothetical protein